MTIQKERLDYLVKKARVSYYLIKKRGWTQQRTIALTRQSGKRCKEMYQLMDSGGEEAVRAFLIETHKRRAMTAGFRKKAIHWQDESKKWHKAIYGRTPKEENMAYYKVVGYH